MNSWPHSPTVRSESPSAECLSDAQLTGLIEKSRSGTHQARWITHLDECEDCRARLEALAADDDQWTAVRCNLNQRDEDLEIQSTRLTAAIAGFQVPTRADLTSGSSADIAVGSATGGRTPERIGDYQIWELLGRGGMGQVYKAYDAALERFVAIKRISDALLEQPESLQRFRREAKAAAAIHNPHVVAIYTIEDAPPHPYLVMEFVGGPSLEERLARTGRLDWRDVAGIGSDVAAGLAAAHDAGVIHRDIKPGNILLEQETGRAKISDFGLARSLEDGNLTQTGCVRGTPEYIAPEQAAGEAIDGRADLFSLGSVLYAACTGGPPFHADGTLAVLRRVREDKPRPISEFRDDIPPALVQIIERLLCKDPAGRFDSAREVSQVLQRVQAGQPVTVASTRTTPPTRSLRRVVLTLAASLLLIVGAGAAGVYAVSQLQGNAGTDGLLSAVDQKKTRRPKRPKQPDAGSAEQLRPAESGVSATPTDAAADAPAPPARVQIVTPNDLLRERIQAEKDRLEVPQHPLLVRQFLGHTGPVNCIAVTPDNELLISCSGWPTGDRTARIWDLASGQELRQLAASEMPKSPLASGPREAPGEFSALAVAPDGRYVVTGAMGCPVCVWETATGKLVRRFDKHATTVYDAAISAQGDVVLTGGRDSIGRLWDLSTGQELLQLAGHRSWIRAVAISPDGRRALTGSYDNVMRLWDLERAEMVRAFESQENWIWDIAFAPSGKMAACVTGTLVQLWDLESGELIRSLSCRDAGNGTSVDISPNGRLAVSAGYDGRVRLWAVDTGELLETYTGHRDWVWTAKFTTDGQNIISAGGGRYTATGGTEPGVDFAIRLWNLPATGPSVVKPN